MYHFDDSHAPLYRYRLSGRMTLEDVAALERDLGGVIARARSYASVIDLSELEFPERAVVTEGSRMSRRLSVPIKQIYEQSPAEPNYFTAYVMATRITRLVTFLHRVASRNIAAPNIFTSVDEATVAAQRALDRWASPG